MSDPRVFVIENFAGSSTVYFDIDAANTGSLFGTMWGRTASFAFNGATLAVEGDNQHVLSFRGDNLDFFLPDAKGIVSADARLFGNNANNTIWGSQQGANFLNGFGGVDSLVGGAGNDIFVFDGTTDNFSGQGGVDTILAQASYSLSANPLKNDFIENIRLRGGYEAAIEATGDNDVNGLFGNEFNNMLNGLGGDDELRGGAGNDVLNGDAGRDTLFGNSGDDTLNGGAGTDRLTGGTGNDTLDGGGSLDWMLWYANAFNTADMAAGTQDTVVNGAGDRLNFTATLEALLNHFGTNLGSAEADIAIGSQFGDGGNVRFADGQLQIDLNSDGQFIAADDFAIALGGVSSVTYNAQGDYFLLG